MELGEFIRLDTEEKTKFISTNLTYLIETVQTQSGLLEHQLNKWIAHLIQVMTQLLIK